MQFNLKVSDVGDGHVSIECTPAAREIIGSISYKIKNGEEPTGAEHYMSKILLAVKGLNEEVKKQMMGLDNEDLVDIDRISKLQLPGRDF